MLWIVLSCHPVTYRLLLCNKRLNKCPILEVPLSAFRMQLTSHSSWTEQDFAFIFCFWDLVMTPTNMGYSEIELPEVSSQHHLAALMLASLSTRRIHKISRDSYNLCPPPNHWSHFSSFPPIFGRSKKTRDPRTDGRMDGPTDGPTDGPKYTPSYRVVSHD